MKGWGYFTTHDSGPIDPPVTRYSSQYIYTMPDVQEWVPADDYDALMQRLATERHERAKCSEHRHNLTVENHNLKQECDQLRERLAELGMER